MVCDCGMGLVGCRVQWVTVVVEWPVCRTLTSLPAVDAEMLREVHRMCPVA